MSREKISGKYVSQAFHLRLPASETLQSVHAPSNDRSSIPAATAKRSSRSPVSVSRRCTAPHPGHHPFATAKDGLRLVRGGGDRAGSEQSRLQQPSHSLSYRCAGRFPPSPGSEPGVGSAEGVSSAPSALGPGAATDQRPPFIAYSPCPQPFFSSFRIDGSLIRRSKSMAARASISGGVRPGRSRRICSTKRRTEPLESVRFR